MKTTFLLPFILPLGILATACNKKTKDESLAARVVEYGTNKPIPNVGVLVHYYIPGNGLSGGHEVPYDSVISNANGEVFLDGSEYDPSDLKIYTRDTNYFDNWPGGGPTYSVTEPFKKNPVIELYPYAWVKLRFIKKSELHSIGVNSLPGQIFPFDIYTEDTLLLSSAKGNTWNIITLYPYKNGQALPSYLDSVYTPGHDTTYYEIEW